MPTFHRPTWRKSTIEELERRTPKNEDGEFLDPDGEPIHDNKYQVGHKPGYEFRKIDARAAELGKTQADVNDYNNNPEILQLEEGRKNQGHKNEAPDEIDYTTDMEQEM